MIYRNIIFPVLCLCMLVACRDKSVFESSFCGVYHQIDTAPDSVIRILDSIDYVSLSTRDRHLYDFIRLKANDRAYVRHESDSVIIDLLNFSRYEDVKLRTEILYYAGRVYSDLGNYPEALKNYYIAIDEIEAQGSDADFKLKASLFRQTGKLLYKLRLYDEAQTYAEEALKLDKKLKDRYNEVAGLQLLGAICLKSKQYKRAVKFFKEALLKIDPDKNTQIAKTKVYIAAAYSRIGYVDSAMNYIRNTVEAVHPVAKNTALAYSAEIYRANGFLDSAYMFARQLVESKDRSNAQTGYYILLSPEMSKFVSIDSAIVYVHEYRDLIERLWDENKNELVLMQEAKYNYDSRNDQLRESGKAGSIAVYLVIAVMIIMTIAVCVIIYYRIETDKQIKTLHDDILTRIERRGSLGNDAIEDITSDCDKNSELMEVLEGEVAKSVQREHLKERLLSSYDQVDPNRNTPTSLLESSAYMELMDYVTNERGVPSDCSLWNELQSAISKVSPDFLKCLNILTNGKLTSYDLHTALLIKCGLTPKQMGIVFSRSKGSIVSRRDALCIKIFETKLSTKVFDAIIRSL